LILLNHLVDGPGEYVVVDMTAGADSSASGLFTRFDLTVLVCEPTLRSVGVYREPDNLTALATVHSALDASNGTGSPTNARSWSSTCATCTHGPASARVWA
jgi:CO dehydrogenase nickel-insertion accessory protein CooC1